MKLKYILFVSAFILLDFFEHSSVFAGDDLSDASHEPDHSNSPLSRRSPYCFKGDPGQIELLEICLKKVSEESLDRVLETIPEEQREEFMMTASYFMKSTMATEDIVSVLEHLSVEHKDGAVWNDISYKLLERIYASNYTFSNSGAPTTLSPMTHILKTYPFIFTTLIFEYEGDSSSEILRELRRAPYERLTSTALEFATHLMCRRDTFEQLQVIREIIANSSVFITEELLEKMKIVYSLEWGDITFRFFIEAIKTHTLDQFIENDLRTYRAQEKARDTAERNRRREDIEKDMRFTLNALKRKAKPPAEEDVPEFLGFERIQGSHPMDPPDVRINDVCQKELKEDMERIAEEKMNRLLPLVESSDHFHFKQLADPPSRTKLR